MAKRRAEILSAIKRVMDGHGGQYSNWYVGITDDIDGMVQRAWELG